MTVTDRLIAADPRIVTVHQPDAAPVTVRAGDVLDGGDVVPGLRCVVGKIFDS